MFEQDETVWMFVVSMKAPVMNEEEEGDVIVPVLVLPTRQTMWLKKWLTGQKIQTQHMH